MLSEAGKTQLHSFYKHKQAICGKKKSHVVVECISAIVNFSHNLQYIVQ